MVELILAWFLVFHLRGRYEDILTLLERHESLAMSSGDNYLRGMYLSYMGWAYQRREQLDKSRHYLLQALKIGEQANNHKVTAYACACLIWTCTDQGRLDDALTYAARAESASRSFESEDPTWSIAMDQNLVRFVLTGAAIASWFQGDCEKCRRLGDRLLDYGKAAGDDNSISEGYLAHGMACFAGGDFAGAIAKCRTAMGISADPLFVINARFLMAYANLAAGEISQAERELAAIVDFCRASGYEYIGTSATALSSIVSVARGRLSKGIRTVKGFIEAYAKSGKPFHAMSFHYLLGRIYLGMVLGEGRVDAGLLLRNLPFLMIHYPKAAGHARHHFTTAINMAGRINAPGIKAQALLDLGRLHGFRRQYDLARPLLEESLTLFEKLGATVHLARARKVMADLAVGKSDG